MGGGRALWWADDGTCVVRTSLWVHGRTQARGVRAGWVGQSENFEEGEAERNMPEQKAKLVVGALVVWFGSQIVASVVNRALLGNKKKSVYPLTFSFCQFFVATLLDFVFLATFFNRDGSVSVRQVARTITKKVPVMYPMVLMMMSSKYLSMVAYKLISIPLFQTIKCTSPLALVVLTKLWLGKSYPPIVYILLIPILAGAMLASFGDYEFNSTGAVAALIATFCTSFQRLYIKEKILTTDDNDILPGGGGQRSDGLVSEALRTLRMTILGHFELAVCASLLMFPIVTVQEFRGNGRGNSFDGGFPYAQVIFGASMQWLASLCAWQCLAMMNPLSANIAKIVQRMLSIVSSILIFHNQVGAINGFGMVLAFGGVGLYSYVYGKKTKTVVGK